MRFSDSINGHPEEGPILLRSGNGDTVAVPDPAVLFSAEFSRHGADLVLENTGAPDVRIVGYFSHPTAPDLTTPDGATLRGHVVERLAGPEAPGQYAQADGALLGDPIGQVETLDGIARAQRVDGTVVELQVGAKVYRNDVLVTESSGKVSVTFVDGTIFTLASGSRMVLDDLVYAEGSGENSAAFSLVEGSFVFIAGQVAKTGGMDVTTPSATMGIRGTTVLVDIQTVQGVTTVAVSLNTDPDGGLGEIVIRDLDGNEITTITTTDTKWVVPVGSEAYEVDRTADDLATDAEILADAATAYASSLARLEAGQTFVDLDSGSPRSGTGDTDSETGAGTDLGAGSDDGDDGDDGGGGADGGAPEGTAPPPDLGPDPAELDGNRAPVPDDASFESPEDVRLDGILAANDPDGDPLSFTLQAGAENGVVVLLETGEFTFTPNEDHFGPDSFTFVASDGRGGTATGTVTIDVTPVDDPPVAPDAANAGTEDTIIAGRLAATDIDSPDADITYVPADPESPLPAGVTLAPNGDYALDATDPAYQDLAAGEQRIVTFDYTAISGDLSDPATVAITVTGVNDAPALAAATIDAVEDGPAVDIDLAALGDDADSDDDGTTLGYAITAAPGAGTATLSGSTLGFDPGGDFQDLAAGETRDVAIGVTATDAGGATAVTDITVTVTGVNDDAVIGGVTTGAVTEDAAATLTTSGALSITDPDAGEAVFQAQTGTAGSAGLGSFSLDAAGNWTYAADNSQATLQALGAGETATDSFTAVSADGITQVVTVTLTGVNDDAVIGGVTTGAVTEDAAATLTTSGALSITDPDAGEAVFQAQTGTAGSAGLGSFSLDAAGNWTYAADNSQATLQALGAGETATDSFTAVSADGITQVVTVTLTGVNDDAVIGGVTTGAVTEDAAATLTTSGALSITDPDAGEAVFQAQTGTAGSAGLGSFSLDAAGNWTYAADNSQATLQALGAGETATDSFTAVSADGITQVVTVTLTGVNDDAVIGGVTTGAVTEDAAATLTTSGALSITDPDAGEAVFQAQTGTAGSAGLGSFSLDAAGNWTYAADNSQATLQALGAGETATDSFTAVSADGITQVVTVTLTGVNDDAVIGGVTTGAVTEDAAATLTTSGALSITDPDAGEAVFQAQTGTAGSAGLGSFSLDAAGNWTYAADNSQATLQALGAGETATDSFTAVSADGITQVVTVTLTGVNDDAVIGGVTTGAVTEDAAATLTTSGALSITDPDAGEAVFQAQTGTAGSAGLGSFSLDAAGNWTYAADNSQATLQALGAGETATDSFTAVSADGITQVVTVTLTGVNDDAVIGGVTTGAVTEDAAATLTTSGALSITDPDAGEAVFQAQTGTAGSAGLGSFSLDAAGNWTYAADNSQATLQALGAGETATDSFTAVSADGITQVVTVTLTGVNDDAVIGGVTTGAVTEDAAATLTTSGALSITDPDAGEAVFQAQTGTAGSAGLGSFSLDAAGNWTYAADNSQATLQALGAGETATDSFTAVSADGITQVVTVTLTGVNDDAVIGGVTTGAVTEDAAATLTTSGALSITDPDAGEAVFQAQTGTAGSAGLGSFSLDAAGNWTYAADNSQATLQALGAGETATDSFTAVSADGITQVVTVTLTGVNDAPTLAAANAAADEDGPVVTLNLAALGTDIDSDDDGTTLDYTITGAPGEGTATISGTTLGFDPGNAFQDLAEGETRDVTIRVTATDDHGATDENDVTVTITGVDDDPVISVADFDPVPEGDTGVLSNVTFDPATVLTASDVDNGETPQIVAGSLSIVPDEDSDTNNVAPFSIGQTATTVDTANYDFLAAEETGRFILSFEVQSGGQVSPHSALIEITGQSDNAAPVAEDVFVEGDNSGDITGAIPITDPDDTSFSFTFPDGGPSKGSIVFNTNGSFTYTPDSGETGFDDFTVQVSDGEDSTDVTVTVALEQDGGAQANEGNVGLGINLATGQDDPAGSARVERSATPLNVVFALDESGSIGATNFGIIITAVEDALSELRTKFGGTQTQVDVKFIPFDNSATPSPTFDLFADANNNGTFDAEEALDVIEANYSAGGTNFVPPLTEAENFLANEPNNEANFLYFVTDGQPFDSASIGQALESLRTAVPDLDIQTFGIGSGFDASLLEDTYTENGTVYAFDSDGATVVINTANELGAAIQDTPLFTAELVSFELTLTSDGVDHGVIATDTSDGFEAQGLDFLLPFASIDGIEDKLGETNDFEATAVFDLDGDPVGTTGDQLTVVEIGRLTRPDEAVTLVGNAGDDLLLGGADADSLEGGGGNDLLIGGGGDDSLLGGAGDDLLVLGGPSGTVLADGGIGRDTLKFDIGGDLTSGVLPTLTINDIEALDMENGQTNDLSLTLADIEGLSTERDTFLEALLGGALPDPDSATVYGDAGDSLTLTNPDGPIEENQGTGPVADGNGTTFDIYQFFDGSNTLLATLAVDEDVSVVTA